MKLAPGADAAALPRPLAARHCATAHASATPIPESVSGPTEHMRPELFGTSWKGNARQLRERTRVWNA